MRKRLSALRTHRRLSRLSAVVLAVVLVLVLAAMLRVQGGASATEPAHQAHHAGMTDAEMKRAVDEWFAYHPQVGANAAHATAAATFTVQNFRFDSDGSAATQVDTVKITTGQSVTWTWIDGAHTITNGPNSGDPLSGSMFDRASDTAHPSYTYTFVNEGTFPFFCRPHELDNMRGVVVVKKATFVVEDFRFDSDNNPLTQVDTVKIVKGQSVTWTWLNGTHTITNGTGSTDPQAGNMFNQPSDATHTSFSFTFNTAGMVPFFCSFHEMNPFNMRGVVVVENPPVSVIPMPASGRLGFVSGPAPNPSRGEFSFHFTMREPGRVRADVLDVRGARNAVLLDRELGSGTWAMRWDGRGTSGRAPAGVYYVRLRLPGYEGTRRVVLAH